MGDRVEEMHKQVRRGRSAAFGALMDKVYTSMTPAERGSLPTTYPNDIGWYVNAMTAHALGRLPDFEHDLKQAVAGTFEENTTGERFILDSVRTNSLNTFCLFVDVDGELVTVRDPELERVKKDEKDPGTLALASYNSYEILTGPQASQSFARHARPLPALLALEASTGVHRARKRLRVFLCHASEDKAAVRNLRRTLSTWGHEPWLDEDQILPGQDWEREIRQAMKQAHIVLVFLSSRSQKKGYVQKELKRALDIADEQPEGTIFIIPVKLEPCAVPERLTTWQWVDLFSAGGEEKLAAALQAAAASVPESEMRE